MGKCPTAPSTKGVIIIIILLEIYPYTGQRYHSSPMPHFIPTKAEWEETDPHPPGIDLPCPVHMIMMNGNMFTLQLDMLTFCV